MASGSGASGASEACADETEGVFPTEAKQHGGPGESDVPSSRAAASDEAAGEADSTAWSNSAVKLERHQFNAGVSACGLGVAKKAATGRLAAI